MNFKNEKQLLFVIRYTLPLLILFLSGIITTFLYYDHKITFEKVKQNTEEKFIQDKKQLIKEMVDNVYDYVISEHKQTEENLKKSLISRVHEAHRIIINIYKEYAHKVSEEELTLLIRTAIKDIRFNNNRGYFFVYDKKAVNIIHPLVPRLEGKNLINHKDTKGTFVLQDSLSLLKSQAESYQEWYWRKVKGDMNEYKKIGFVKNIYELDWFIGTGEYVEDFAVDVQKKVLSQVDKFKFGTNGYLFAFNEKNIYLTHPVKKLVGTSALKRNNLNNTKLIMEKMWEKAKTGGGFVEYMQKINPITKQPTVKISYVKFIPEWNWLIGTGFYKKEVQVLINKEQEILASRYNENIQNVLIFAALITLVLLTLSFYISYVIELKFKNYKSDIKHHIAENQQQYELLAQKSKLAAMGEMMENIAHQWRQPLSVITTVSSGVKLQKEMKTLDDNNLMESMDSIGNSARHLSETINDFRDFFKPDKEKTLFTLQSALEKTFKLLSSQITNKDITIIENVKTITIQGFERELLQVLLNVLNNAKDALEGFDGERYIFIDVYEKDKIICINIKDNAGGIPSDIIERIFEPYFTTKHQSVGTGLGLYMSREIITRHMSGSLEVTNENFTYEDKSYCGANFLIKLPKE